MGANYTNPGKLQHKSKPQLQNTERKGCLWGGGHSPDKSPNHESKTTNPSPQATKLFRIIPYHQSFALALGHHSESGPHTCLMMFCPVTFWMTAVVEALGAEFPGELMAGLLTGLTAAGRFVTVSPVCPGPGRCTEAAAVCPLTGTVATTA